MTHSDSTLDLEELKALLAKASPLPWMSEQDQVRRQETDSQIAKTFGVVQDRNAALIVAAVNALPDLLDEIERLRARESVGGITEKRLAAARHAIVQASINLAFGDTVAAHDDIERAHAALNRRQDVPVKEDEK